MCVGGVIRDVMLCVTMFLMMYHCKCYSWRVIVCSDAWRWWCVTWWFVWPRVWPCVNMSSWRVVGVVMRVAGGVWRGDMWSESVWWRVNASVVVNISLCVVMRDAWRVVMCDYMCHYVLLWVFQLKCDSVLWCVSRVMCDVMIYVIMCLMCYYECRSWRVMVCRNACYGLRVTWWFVWRCSCVIISVLFWRKARSCRWS